jgi:hypothetical protein
VFHDRFVLFGHLAGCTMADHLAALRRHHSAVADAL